MQARKRKILRALQFCKEYLHKSKILHIFAIYFWGSMLISNKLILDDFVQRHSRAVRPINKWVEVVAQAVWRNHQDLKKCFPSADYVGNGRYIFNISGNNYRIIAVVLFVGGVMELRFVGDKCQVAGDPLMLRRALSNLLSNALRYTPTGETIVVRCQTVDHLVQVIVENPGTPIAPEHLPRLFDRFYRVDPSRQRKGEGSGIGLAIVKSIVVAHKGTVAVTSDARGTRFVITLPA